MKISFYQVLDETPAAVEAVVPKLLEKVLESGQKAVVFCPNKQRMNRLDDALWMYEPTSFLPHGTELDGRHLVTLTCSQGVTPEGGAAPAADVLVLVSGAQAGGEISGYGRVLDVFEAGDLQKKNARTRWKEWRDMGHDLDYFAHEEGRWVKKT